MSQQALFNLGIVSGLLAWSIVTWQCVWPELRHCSRRLKPEGERE